MSTYGVTRPQLFIIFTILFSESFHTTVPSAKMPFHSITIFTLAYLLPLSLVHIPQQKKTPFKLAILYNKSIADAHPSFLFEEAILFCDNVAFDGVFSSLIWNSWTGLCNVYSPLCSGRLSSLMCVTSGTLPPQVANKDLETITQMVYELIIKIL